MKRLAVKAGTWIYQVQNQIAQETLPEFATSPKGLVIRFPREISNPKFIHIGDDVKLGPNSVLKASTSYPGGWLEHPEGKHVNQSFTPKLVIGDRVTATSALQVAAFQQIIIEDDVMFASNIFICDGMHAYDSGSIPYKYQGITRIAPITIGRGSWIGQNVVILPGVTIGENAIVGANSLVAQDIPASSVAAGNPARVMKRWDEEHHSWRSTAEVPA